MLSRFNVENYLISDIRPHSRFLSVLRLVRPRFIDTWLRVLAVLVVLVWHGSQHLAYVAEEGLPTSGVY